MLDTILVARDVPSQTPALIAVTTVFFIITTAFMAARLLWRYKHQQRGWDDLIAISAYTNLIILSAFGYTAARYGFGKHKADIPRTFSRALYWFYLYQIFYKILGGLTKLVFCALYYRIFERQNFQKVVLAVAGIIIAGTVAFTFGTIFQCTPIKYNWDKSHPGHCIVFMSFWYSHAVFNTFMDMVVFILPIPLIRTLQMAKRTKVGLISVFALGAFTIAASIIRMVMLRRSAQAIAVDPTWGSTTALIWTEIEANTSVICCTLPALRQLAVQIWRVLLGKKGPETSFDNSEHPKPQPNRLAPQPLSPHQQHQIPSNPFSDEPPTTIFPRHPTTDPTNQFPPGYFGTHSDIRYSPPSTSKTHHGDEIIHLNTLSPNPAPSRPQPLRKPGIFDRFLPIRTSTPRRKNNTWETELESGPKISDNPPQIPRRVRDVHVESFRVDGVDRKPRPGIPRSEGGYGVNDEERALTFEEMLRQGPYGKG